MPEDVCSKCGRLNLEGEKKSLVIFEGEKPVSQGDSDSKKPESQIGLKRTKFPRRVIRDKKDFDNTYHPGVEGSDLGQRVHWISVSEHPMDQYGGFIDDWSNPKTLCHNCGLNTVHYALGGYTSRLKLFHTRNNSAIWDLGPNGPWMLRDEVNGFNTGFKMDYMVQEFIRKENPKLPIVEMHRFGGPEDKFHFTVMARAKGDCMGDIWYQLTLEEQEDAIKDLAKYIKEWRKITRPHIQAVDGSELHDVAIGNCTGWGCIKTGLDEETWLENLTPGMRKGLLGEIWFSHRGETVTQATLASWAKQVDEKIVELKASFPRGGPYVLTHGDLHSENIFISKDNEEGKFKVSAIIDWELAGFYPWWAEQLRFRVPDLSDLPSDYSCISHPGYNKDDFEEIWKNLGPVKEAWYDGGNHTQSKHVPDQSNRWYAPPFCACKPYSQAFRDNELVGEKEGHLDIYDIDSTDSEDDEKDDNCLRFPKGERQFLRWFNKISNPSSKHADSTSAPSIAIIPR